LPVSPIAVTLHRRDPAAAVVGLLGEHDAYTAARLENEVSVLIGDHVHVVIDLTEASFIDSYTLSVLLSARHEAEEVGLGYIVVLPADAHTQVRRILEMTGLDAAFAVARTIEQALDRARSGDNAGERLRVG
jgi:anti-anti-sigma factor